MLLVRLLLLLPVRLLLLLPALPAVKPVARGPIERAVTSAALPAIEACCGCVPSAAAAAVPAAAASSTAAAPMVQEGWLRSAVFSDIPVATAGGCTAELAVGTDMTLSTPLLPPVLQLSLLPLLALLLLPPRPSSCASEERMQ